MGLTRMLVALLDERRGDWRHPMMAWLIDMLDMMAETP
jgi:hypothetical protein